MPDIKIGALTSETASGATWDSVWIGDEVTPGGYADWVENGVGLEGSAPIATAILLCLFTDRRLPDDQAPPNGFDRRGWHGDTFDLDASAGERPMGSLLWTLERAALDKATARLAEFYAGDALQTLVDQKVVGEFDISSSVDGANSMLVLRITANAPTGEQVFSASVPVMGSN